MTPRKQTARDSTMPTVATLYVVRGSPDSAIAFANLQSALSALPGERTPVVEVIDVTEFPLATLEKGIFVTPTLRLDHGGKQSTMFGDLSDPLRIAAFFASLTT